MQALDDESVDLVVTSPPYDDLRTYNDTTKWDMQVFYGVAAQLTRVLKPGGVIMWNVNDARSLNICLLYTSPSPRDRG